MLRRSAIIILLALGIAWAQDLSFWTWRTEDKAAYEEMFDVYEAANPGVTISFQAFPNDEYATKLSTALAAGEGPDVIHVRAYGAFEAVAEPGYLLPIGDEVTALSEFSDLARAGETLRSDGQVYAVPFASQTLLVYYNTRIFEELGLGEPADNWDAFAEQLQAVQDAGIIPLANGSATGWMDEVLFGAFAPAFYGEGFLDELVSGETTFEDERFVTALEKLTELTPYLAPDHVGVDYESAQQLFVNELAAMFVGGSWEIANFRGQNAELPFSVDAPPAAQEGGQQVVSSFLDGGYAVNATTENTDDAVTFVNWLASEEFGQMLTDKLANISPVPGVTPSDPLLTKVAEFNQSAAPYLMLVGFRYPEYQPNGSEIIQNALQTMLAGDMSPQEVARTVQEGIAPNHPPFQ